MPSEPDDQIAPRVPTPEEDYEHFVRDPLQWRLKAQTLFRASCVLFDTFTNSPLWHQEETINSDDWAIVDAELFQPAAMLAGLSIELFLKSIIVAKDPSRLDPKRGLNDWAQGPKRDAHNLVALAKEAGLSDALDTEILKILTDFSIWKGRYPSSIGGTPYYGHSADFENFGGTFWFDAFDRYKKLYETVRQAASKTAK